MGLGFLVPAFLAGLAALLVPLLLHLRHWERERPHRFPSLMFLRRIPIRIARRRRITDWLLLLLRAAVVAALVVAFARPFFHQNVPAGTPVPARAVVVALDRSLSMGHREVWSAARDSARAIVAGLRPEDRVAVVLFDEEAEVAMGLTVDHAAALATIAGAAPTARGTRYVAALRAARQVLASARGLSGEVLVVTDLQRSGLAGLAGLELPADVAVRAVPAGPRTRANAALVGADVQRTSDGDRSKLLVSAKLSARELGAPRKTRITLTVNGRAAASRDVTLPADGAVSAAFEAVPLPAGRVRAVLSLEPDALAADDTLRFVVPPDQALRILLVVPADVAAEETLFLERALGIGAAPRLAVERRSGASLDARILRGAWLVVLFDAPVPAGPPGAALESWVRAGGGLVVAAGRRLAGRAAAQRLVPGTMRGIVERVEDRGGTFGEVSLDHPVFAPFREGGGAALGAARFFRYPRVEPAPGAEVLARFDDGTPALLSRSDAAGRVMLVTAPLDGIAGDFPLQAAYLPFLRRLALYTAGHQTTPPWRVTGESAALPEGVRQPVISTPAGQLLRPVPDSGRGAVALRDAGFYEVYEGRAAGDPLEVLAVNPPAAESDLTPADPRELLLGVQRSDSLLAAVSGPPTLAEREGRQRVWRLVLAFAAGLLFLEMIVANRGWRGTASPVIPVSSERSAP